MFKKFFSTVFIGSLFLTTCLAQLPSALPTDSKTKPKLTRENLLRYQESAKPDYTKESYKVPPKAAKMSKGKKTALWVGLIAAGAVITAVIIFNANKYDPKPCGGASFIC